VDAHWRARHEGILPYDRFWKGLCREHRSRGSLGCPSCRKGIPIPWPCQCPECAQVFKGKGWEGIDAHWRRNHSDVMKYEDFLASLCPGHRRPGDRETGYLPLK